MRAESAKGMTFKQCAEAYIKAHRAGWRNPRHAAQWPQTFEAYVYPVFGGLPVQTVDVGLVTKALEPIWTVKPETASRVRSRIENVLDWATARGHRRGENPARWRGHLENLLPKKSKVRQVEHHAALAYVDIGAFVAKLRQQEGVAARALEFAILTVARTAEALGARWDELDLAEKTWTLPAGRMKTGVEHRVPISERALEILEEMQVIRQGDLVFPGARRGRPLSHAAMLRVLAAMECRTTVHGFRSSFSTWASEITGFPPEVIEGALAHAVGNTVARAYRRGDLFDKRRLLMGAWAQYCATPVTGADVVPLATARHR
jgi:integrase